MQGLTTTTLIHVGCSQLNELIRCSTQISEYKFIVCIGSNARVLTTKILKTILQQSKWTQFTFGAEITLLFSYNLN